jgi:hypothetical protein
MTTYNENQIKIENYDYDLNSLFNFQANFDQLKFVITALARSQRKMYDRMISIENNLKITEKGDGSSRTRRSSVMDGVNNDGISNFNEGENVDVNDYENNLHDRADKDQLHKLDKKNQSEKIDQEISNEYLFVIYVIICIK